MKTCAKNMSKFFIAIILSIFLTLYGYNYLFASEVNKQGNISLTKILSIVKKENLEIKSVKEKLIQSDFDKKQSKLLPNPEFEAAFENFKGNGDFKDTNALEKTFSLSYLFELGNKRHLRYSVLSFNKDIAELEYNKVETNILSYAVKKYFQILLEQEWLKLINHQMHLLKHVSILSNKRKEAGKASQLEIIKMKLLLEEYDLKRKTLIQKLNQKKRDLSLLCNSENVFFDNVLGDIEDIARLVSKKELVKHIFNNNDYLKQLIEEKKINQKIKLSKVKILPDVTLNAGIRYFNESDENDKAYTAGISLPFPLFDRGQQEILKNKSVLKEKKIRKEFLNKWLKSSFNNYYEQLERLFNSISVIKEKILPLTQESIESAKDGFSKGRFNYIEVLDVYKVYYDIKHKLLDSLIEYHFLYIDFRIFLGLGIMEV